MPFFTDSLIVLVQKYDELFASEMLKYDTVWAGLLDQLEEQGKALFEIERNTKV